MGQIYFWSDTHFNHSKIIEHCHRAYNSVEAMNEDLIRRWNSAVSDTDTIYHLGDFGFSHSKLPSLESIFAQLRGYKILVVGNHDERNPDTLRLGWQSIKDIAWVKQDGRRAMACHYPMETWKQSHHGSIMVHGHCHGTLKTKLPHRFDVGADVFYRPVTFVSLQSTAAGQIYIPTDRHGDKNNG